MNTEDFENRLQKMPPRELPSAWRGEILTAAKGSQTHEAFSVSSVRRLTSSVLDFLKRPHGLAWSGIAALWILIMTLNLTGHEPSRSAEAQMPSARMMLALQREKQFLLAELNGALTPVVALPPKPTPAGPRSSRTAPTTTI